MADSLLKRLEEVGWHFPVVDLGYKDPTVSCVHALIPNGYDVNINFDRAKITIGLINDLKLAESKETGHDIGFLSAAEMYFEILSRKRETRGYPILVVPKIGRPVIVGLAANREYHRLISNLVTPNFLELVDGSFNVFADKLFGLAP